MIKAFSLQRQIIGTCPSCSGFFRLSDCRIYQRKAPPLDWLGRLSAQQQRIDAATQRLEEQEGAMREKARQRGQKLASQAVRKLDPVFTPRKLNPDDAKVVFHPIDYIVFAGMKDKVLKNIVLLDQQVRQPERRSVQRSIERVVERECYEWQTLRVQEDGKIRSE
jgi:predicted Holliday junction resolvase-like endonuclease